jgi:hypothetical protein
MDSSVGQKAIRRALTRVATIATAIARRLSRIASASAPPGTWLAVPAIVPMLKEAPIALNERPEPGLKIRDEEIQPV